MSEPEWRTNRRTGARYPTIIDIKPTPTPISSPLYPAPDVSEERDWVKLQNANFPYYVTMTDKFFTGWGGAKNRTAKYVAGADSLQEARIVAQNAKLRGDQKNVSIRTTKPRYNPRYVRLGWMDKEQSKRWYIPGGFAEGTP